MKFRDIPEKYFEIAGIGIGFIGPVVICMQIHAEWFRTTPSTLSMGFLIGYLVIFVFWFLYGMRFARVAVWFGNALGIILQSILIALVLLR